MATVTVITTSTGEIMTVPGKPSANLVHEVAEAFIQGAPLSPFKLKVAHALGRWRFRRYAIDFTGKVAAQVTFSLLVKPDVVHFKRGVIAIAPKHAAAFELRFTVCDLVEPGGSAAGARPFYVS